MTDKLFAFDNVRSFVVIDCATDTVIYTSPASLPFESGFAAVVSYDNSAVFACGTGSYVIRVDPTTYAFTGHIVGGSNQAIACKSDASFAYLVNTTNGALHEVDGTSLVPTRVLLGYAGAPRSLCISPDDLMLFCGDGFTAVERALISTLSSVAPVVGGAQYGISIDLVGARLYGSATGANALRVMDNTVDPPAIIRSIDLVGGGGGTSPRNNCVTDNGLIVCVACNASGEALIIDPRATLPILARIAITNANNVSLSPDNTKLYVADGSPIITIISMVTYAIIGTIDTGLSGVASIASQWFIPTPPARPDVWRPFVTLTAGHYNSTDVRDFIDTGKPQS